MSEEELERLLEERVRELSKRLEEFRRALKEREATVKGVERGRLAKKVLDYAKRG